MNTIDASSLLLRCLSTANGLITKTFLISPDRAAEGFLSLLPFFNASISALSLEANAPPPPPLSPTTSLPPADCCLSIVSQALLSTQSIYHHKLKTIKQTIPTLQHLIANAISHSHSSTSSHSSFLSIQSSIRSSYRSFLLLSECMAVQESGVLPLLRSIALLQPPSSSSFPLHSELLKSLHLLARALTVLSALRIDGLLFRSNNLQFSLNRRLLSRFQKTLSSPSIPPALTQSAPITSNLLHPSKTPDPSLTQSTPGVASPQSPLPIQENPNEPQSYHNMMLHVLPQNIEFLFDEEQNTEFFRIHPSLTYFTDESTMEIPIARIEQSSSGFSTVAVTYRLDFSQHHTLDGTYFFTGTGSCLVGRAPCDVCFFLDVEQNTHEISVPLWIIKVGGLLTYETDHFVLEADIPPGMPDGQIFSFEDRTGDVVRQVNLRLSAESSPVLFRNGPDIIYMLTVDQSTLGTEQFVRLPGFADGVTFSVVVSQVVPFSVRYVGVGLPVSEDACECGDVFINVFFG